MIETITLASVGATALAEGIRFLYEQAGEALRGLRERRRAAHAGGGPGPGGPGGGPAEGAPAGVGAVQAAPAGGIPPQGAQAGLPGGVPPASAFDIGDGTRLAYDPAVVEQLSGELSGLRHALMDYADGVADADPADARLLAVVDSLRRAMEAASGARLTFRGEQRPAPGPRVSAQARIEEVRGNVAVLRAENILGGTVSAAFEGRKVAEGGSVTVVDAGTIGGPGSAVSSDSADPPPSGR